MRRFQLGTISLVGAAIEKPCAWLAKPKGLAELRAQIAELTLEKAAYVAQASWLHRAAWHVPDIVVHICSVPRVMQPDTLHATWWASAFFIDSECRACTLSCQITHLGPARVLACTMQVCRFDRRTDGAEFEALCGKFEAGGGQLCARRSVQRRRERGRDFGCIAPRR
jgi:hypothetical protein